MKQKEKKLNWFERIKKKKTSTIMSRKIGIPNKYNNSNKKINISDNDKSNKNAKNLMNLFGNVDNKNKKNSKNYINYFTKVSDKKYFNHNIQVINNYNFYNYERKKEKDNIEDNIINEDNNKVDSNKQNYLIKKSSKKLVNENFLISDKSDNANPPLKKKKKENNNDEIENTEKRSKSPERKNI